MVAQALWTTYIECRVHPPGKEAAHFKLWKVLQTPELDRDLDSAASTRLLEIRWRNSASPSPTLSCSHIYMSIVENFNARWTQGKQRARTLWEGSKNFDCRYATNRFMLSLALESPLPSPFCHLRLHVNQVSLCNNSLMLCLVLELAWFKNKCAQLHPLLGFFL